MNNNGHHPMTHAQAAALYEQAADASLVEPNPGQIPAMGVDQQLIAWILMNLACQNRALLAISHRLGELVDAIEPLTDSLRAK